MSASKITKKRTLKTSDHKNYVYRLSWDSGFAPNPLLGLCCLSGCKETTVEKYAKKGSWVIGIGGINTGKPDQLIYIMKVLDNLTFLTFKEQYPVICKSKYPNRSGPNVLISEYFYYLGDKAIFLPKSLNHIIIPADGCKCVSDEDVLKLENIILKKFRSSGQIGKPNNI